VFENLELALKADRSVRASTLFLPKGVVGTLIAWRGKSRESAP